MLNYAQLSAHGSDRATAYNMSNKIVRRDGQLFAAWLDAPLGPAQPSRVQLGVCDARGLLQTSFQLGSGIDNHCGPALALDASGRMHAIIGAHAGDFHYRYADDPAAPQGWSEPETLGPADTYPALAVSANGTLHLAHREKGERWQLWYRRKKLGCAWDAPRVMAVSPTPGYNHFMQSLSLGPEGSIHLLFQFHYAESGRAIDCKGRAIVHLQSDDNGQSWFNEGRRCDDLPLTIASMQPVCHYPEGEVRVGNHVVDAQNQPWFYASTPSKSGGGLWHRSADGWHARDLAELCASLAPEQAARFAHLDVGHGRSSSISRDRAGQIHLILATNPNGQAVRWYDPSLELFYWLVDAKGHLVALQQVSSPDPDSAHWLPALEQWDWAQPQRACAEAPWFMYTAGLNLGGIGGDNANTMTTKVFLGRLPLHGHGEESWVLPREDV